MKKNHKLTTFFRPASKEVYDAAMAASSTKHKLTLLEQMAHSKAKHAAIALAKKEELARLKALRDAEAQEEPVDKCAAVTKDIRAEIDAVETAPCVHEVEAY